MTYPSATQAKPQNERWLRAFVVALVGGPLIGAGLLVIFLLSSMQWSFYAALPAAFVFARVIARVASTGARDAQFWFRVAGLMVLAVLAAWAGFVLSFIVVWSLGS